nr:AraC family transcriptional regulator [uncultured Dyadobacter sp.]
MARNAIPLHHLADDSKLGLSIQRIDAGDPVDAMLLGAHRDDHGNFFFQDGGISTMMVDFREITLKGCGVFCILPGQVHEPVAVSEAAGWFLGVEMALLDDHHRQVVDQYAQHATPVPLLKEESVMLGQSLEMMREFYLSPGVYKRPVVQSMLKVCLGLFVSHFERDVCQKAGFSRPSAITGAFRKLLAENFKTVKSPAAYAAMQNISSSYLNEVVKDTTGQPVSHWIHNEVMMEAKRLLYYTSLHVKEIAFGLGYDDHTYFSRIFRKTTGRSPGQFREEYRK